MRTVQTNVYTAAELKTAHPAGYARALESWQRQTYDDPAWAKEHADAVASIVEAFGLPRNTDARDLRYRRDELPSIEGPRRVMAWVENNVLAPLRIGWTGAKRWKLSRFGASYRPGCVKPCPFTGYYLDDDLLAVVIKGARAGETPYSILRDVFDEAERLWERDVEDQASERAFLESCDGNGCEFYEDGRMV